MSIKFDPIAVGDKITGHLAEADLAKGAVIEHSKAAGALLVEVAEKHPKHLEPICDRIKLGRSRMHELMQIAGGRRTAEEVKANTKKRVAKHRAKAKALPNPESESSVTRDVTDDASEPQPSPEPENAEPSTPMSDLVDAAGDYWASEATKASGDLMAMFDGAISTLLALKAHSSESERLLAATAHSRTDLDTVASFVAAVGELRAVLLFNR
jgi:ParB-like chromosome segregation protein Spo0J